MLADQLPKYYYRSAWPVTLCALSNLVGSLDGLVLGFGFVAGFVKLNGLRYGNLFLSLLSCNDLDFSAGDLVAGNLASWGR